MIALARAAEFCKKIFIQARQAPVLAFVVVTDIFVIILNEFNSHVCMFRLPQSGDPEKLFIQYWRQAQANYRSPTTVV